MMERVVAKALTERGLTLSVAESCTGGLIGKRLTDIPGSSRFLVLDVVPYDNEMKISVVGVERSLLEMFGAVSGPVVKAMASLIKGMTSSDLGLATTGVAGPGGGSAQKPVGTAFVALAYGDDVTSRSLRLEGSRTWIRHRIAEEALSLICEFLGERRPEISGASTIIVGDEVLSGHTLDTNSNIVHRRLFEMGIPMQATTIVHDRVEEIASALLDAMTTSEIVFVIGGLGPTPDDRTAEAISVALNRPLVFNESAFSMIQRRYREGYESGHVDTPEINEFRRKMALLPTGAEVIENDVGYGPGFAISFDGRTVFALPGVPKELEHTLEKACAMLKSRERPVVREIVYRGSESSIASALKRVMDCYPDVHIGSYPDLEKYETTIRFTGPLRRVEDAVDMLRSQIELHDPEIP